MTDESNQGDEKSSASKGPSTQQEVNLAMMEALRHLAEYTVQVNKLAALGAGHAAGIAKLNGDEASVERAMGQVEDARKAGLRYHNAAMDLWEAFQKDAGDDLVKPRTVTRVPIDE